MPDSQDKSDDLIAELARLMATNAGSPEPESRPGPKPVTVPAAAEAKPLAPPTTTPPATAPTPAPSPAPAASTPAPQPASKPMIRIPGMDQPVPAARSTEPAFTPEVRSEAKTAPAPETRSAPDVSVAPPVTQEKSSIDMGPAPAAAPVRQEPLVSFRMPAAPKPPPTMASVTSSLPETIESKSSPEPGPAPVEPVMERPSGPTAPSEPIVSSPKPQPEGDAFNFDFGFSSEAPEASAETPSKTSTTEAVEPEPARTEAPSRDLIADLIAEELDAAELATPVAAPKPATPTPSVSASPSAASTSRPITAPPPRATPSAPVPVPPPQATARSPEKPARVEPDVPAPVSDDSDPMSEIENLIGEAVRIELGNEQKPAREPVQAIQPVPPPPVQSPPVVPPLTKGFAPRRAAIKDADSGLSSAEAAIRAAAASAGSDPEPTAETKKRPPVRRRGSIMAGGARQYIGIAVAGTLLLAAGFGLYWVLSMGGGDGEAPVLQADSTPVKEAPPATPTSEENQGNVVFGELDGTDTSAGEQLVSRDDSADTPIADVANTVGEGGTGISESELANRKVRTVTVRPDGTIVSGDDSVAGSEALPVDRPNVPDLPGAYVQPSELLASLPTNDPAPADATAGETAAGTGDSATSEPVSSTTASTEPVTPGATVPTASGIEAPIPMPPPNRQALASRAASTAPAASTPAAPVSSGASGSYAQLSSQPSEADAQAALRRLQSRVNGAQLEIRRVDLGSKGVWFRVVLPTGSFQEATQICATIKANGNDCLPING